MAGKKHKPMLSKHQLFNAGGVGLLVLGAVLAVQSHTAKKPQTPLCETRYAGGVLFSLARSGGTPLTPEDLQARLHGLDRALIANSRIVASTDVPFGYALEVALKKASQRAEDDQTRSGIGFTWQPQQLPSATSACLSYSVWVPADFKAGEAGLLPGLFSDAPGDASARGGAPAAAEASNAATDGDAPLLKAARFVVRPMWRADGGLMVWQDPNAGYRGLNQIDLAKAGLRPGRWTRIEMEAVLNAPGKTNGVLRLWIDRSLVLERFDVGFRNTDMQSFQAVVGDIHHVRGGVWAPAPIDTKLRLSPLELRIR